MLSIGKLVLGAEDYYLRSVAKGQEEYYLGSGEAPGYWIGNGASELNLTGEVTDTHLHSILSGCDPNTGSSLGIKQTSPTRVAGFDLTFSAPKSVSILYGLGDDELPAEVTASHNRAVSSALSYLEHHALYARRGAAGNATVTTTGMIACAFRHRTSREGDPQLHTHVLVANVLKGMDGKYSSIYARIIYHHSRTAGFIYQAVLRDELSRSLGVKFTPVTNGIAEIEGIDRDLIDLFSTRRREIIETLDNWHTRSPKAAQIAALETRKPKHLKHAPDSTRANENDEHTIQADSIQLPLKDIWINRSKESGFDPAQLTCLIERPTHRLPANQRETTNDPAYLPAAEPDRTALSPTDTPTCNQDKIDPIEKAVEHLIGAEGLCAYESSFEKRDVYREAAALWQNGASLDTIEHISTAVLESDGIVPLGTYNRYPSPNSDLTPSSDPSSTNSGSGTAHGSDPSNPSHTDPNLTPVSNPDPGNHPHSYPDPADNPPGSDHNSNTTEPGYHLTTSDKRNLSSDPLHYSKRYTTRELLRIEEELLHTAREAAQSNTSVVGEALLKDVISSNPDLSEEQLRMVRKLTSSGDGVEVVVGYAGAGKTYGLRCATEAFDRQGYTVYGYALSARAALELSDGAEIEATTLAFLQGQLAGGEHPFARGDVVIIDEAGMVGTRMLAMVIDEAVPLGAKVVLVGDDRQLPEIAAGGAFRALAGELNPSVLSANRRQESSWEKEALKDLRCGNVERAVRSYTDNERVHFHDSSSSAKTALVSDWYPRYIENRRASTYIYASYARDVDELNDLARLCLKQAGILKEDLYCSKSGQGFADGDDVMCMRNDQRAGVVNGERGKIVAVHTEHLVIQTERGIRFINKSYVDAGNLGYGYASTIHKSQGATISAAFIYGSASLYREAGYVAMSRARVKSDLYVAGGSFETGIDNSNNGPIQHPELTPEALRDMARESLMESLGISRAKHMASDGIQQPSLATQPPRYPHEPPISSHEPTRHPHDREVPCPTRPITEPTKERSYLIDAIGPRPGFPDERPEWDRVASLIESYRAMAGVKGNAALGKRPLDERQRIVYNEAMSAIASYDKRRGRELVLEPPTHRIGHGRF